MRIFLAMFSLVVGTGAVIGCSSIKPSPAVTLPADASSRALTACQKADFMWNDHIVPTVYENLPDLTSPGVLDVLTLAKTSFTIRSLTNDGDELDVGHRKLVHAWGAEARFRFAPSADAHGYTGIYRSGADCVIGRFSVATKPTKTTMVPALALKFFVSGHESVNLQVMNSTSGQESHNFFQLPFSNIIPPPDSLVKRLMQKLFRKAAVAFGARNPDPTHLTVEHLAKIQIDGTAVGSPKSPFRLVFKPTPAAATSMKTATVTTDFRTNLAQLRVGQAIYDVYSFDEGEDFDTCAPNKLIGTLILESEVLASSYGDERLNFQHNMEK
jgi:hypothetical protein